MHFRVGKREKIGLLNVMLCLWVLRQEYTTLTFNFATFFGGNGRRQFLTVVTLFLGGSNDGN